jgi:DNA gyrase/topoisomerase IV subunit B
MLQECYRVKSLRSGDDFVVTATSSVKVAEAQFEGQTKTKLGNRSCFACSKKLWDDWKAYLEENQ